MKKPKVKKTNNRETQEKGDIAVAIVATDLIKKGYTVLRPIFSDHLAFDLLAYRDDVFIRIQVKYRTLMPDDISIIIEPKYYKDGDYFDYYAIYIPNMERVYYPSIKYAGKVLCCKQSNSARAFYWHEDFTSFTNDAKQKTFHDFDWVITRSKTELTIRSGIDRRKVRRPSKEDLAILLWTKPTQQIAKDFGVSDKAIEKWAKSYGIAKPPRGYWMKVSSGKIKPKYPR